MPQRLRAQKKQLKVRNDFSPIFLQNSAFFRPTLVKVDQNCVNGSHPSANMIHPAANLDDSATDSFA